MSKNKKQAKQTKQAKQHKRKIGRNEPCWCGSGRKYKDCHLPIHEEQRADQLKLHEAENLLTARIMDIAQDMATEQPVAFATAFDQFWNSKYTVQQMSELEDLELQGSERFLVWFAFNYILENGQTLVEKLADATEKGEFELDEHEARLIKQWVDVRMRPYIVQQCIKGYGLTARDLLDDRLYEIKDAGATKRMQEGEVMIGHLVPVGTKNAGMPPVWVQEGRDKPEDVPTDGEQDDDTPLFVISGTMAQLTEDTQDKLLEFAGLFLEDLQRTQPDATWNDFISHRSHILNHFVMALPVEEYNSTLIDDFILEARVMMQLTQQSFGEMLSKYRDDEDDEDEDEGKGKHDDDDDEDEGDEGKGKNDDDDDDNEGDDEDNKHDKALPKP